MPGTSSYLTRAWYYFRIGYSTYLTFILGYASTLVTVYYLAIKNIPSLLRIFPQFMWFALPASFIGAPFSIIIGWFHLKRTTSYSAEADITVESNPYSYRLIPGKESEAFAPTYLEMLTLVKKLLEAQKLLTEEDQKRISTVEDKLRALINGDMVGSPRRQALRDYT